MTTLTIHNPATGQVLTQLAADDAASVAHKAQRARAAQPAWAATPLADRIACIARFRSGVVRDLPILAATMTAETGKPITLSRNEINGVLARIDFFLEASERTLAARDGGFHYRWDGDAWRDTRDGSEFVATLARLAGAQAGQPLQF